MTPSLQFPTVSVAGRVLLIVLGSAVTLLHVGGADTPVKITITAIITNAKKPTIKAIGPQTGAVETSVETIATIACPPRSTVDAPLSVLAAFLAAFAPFLTVSKMLLASFAVFIP